MFSNLKRECDQAEILPADADFNQVIKNVRNTRLSFREKCLMKELLCAVDSSNEKKYYRLYEIDSSQNPCEFMYNQNHLKVLASSEKEAALLVGLSMRLLAHWDLSLDDNYSWFYTILAYEDEYPYNIEDITSEEDSEKRKLASQKAVE